jgi:uncharacterized protein
VSANSDSPFRVNLHELPRRAGEMREYKLHFLAPESIGTPLLAIPKGEEVNIDFRAESVSDGVLITGQVRTSAEGECGRCLTPITREIEQDFQELFNYESRKAQEPDEDELFAMDGDFLDLEVPFRDAVILTMPLNPICRPDCRGLCSECGEPWESLEPGHTHEQRDPRWSGLAGWQPK